MKKLLSLVSVLTIGVSAVPSTVAASPFQKDETIKNNNINYQETNNLESLKRNKRDVGSDCENNFANIFEKHRCYISLTPNFFEELIYEYNNNINNESYLKKWFINNLDICKCPYAENKKSNIKTKIFNALYKNFSSVNSKWQNSNKTKRIRIVIALDINFYSAENDNWNIESINIRDDENNSKNKYLEKLWTDFNGDLSKKSINLGVIENNNDNFILNKLKEKYPKLNISYFEVYDKKDYSFFDKSFSTKFKINSNNELIYPIQTLNYKFIFITKKWLNEDLPKLIDNEDLIQNWKSNFSNWQNETNRQINEDLPKYGNDERGKALKKTWKGTNINELNNKLLSLNHILETIDSKFKINELYSKVQNLEKDINELKSQINKLNQKISEIQNSLNKNDNLENCANIGGLISASTGWIPYIGTLISTISGTAAAICTITNA